MKLGNALSVGDIEKMARRRLPRLLYETIASGVEDEHCLTTNTEAFLRYRLRPRYLVDVAVRDASASLFGHRYAAPLGISPTGIAGVFRGDAELMLAAAAAEANVPFIMSGASMRSIDAVARISPQTTWFQLYPARDERITDDLAKRARDAGCEGLVLTVDTPLLPKRERDARNGAGLPFRPRFALALEALLHPGWLVDYALRGGMPRMETWAPYAPLGASAAAIAGYFRTQSPTPLTWSDVEGLRRVWPRRLIVKGIMHPDDALRAAELGADAVFISNHGGKALDRVMAPLDALPAIRAAIGDRIPILLDGGIRRGSDVVIARCLGAAFVFVGRPTLYGVAAAGQPGAARVIEILRSEFDLTLGLIGCTSNDRLDRSFLTDQVGRLLEV